MDKKCDRIELLPPDALRRKCLGISASNSPDMGRLGLFEDHFEMTIVELARAIVIAGGSLYYGGDFRDKGITTFIVRELHRYGKRHDRPLKVCLAWTVHRSMNADQIAKQKDFLDLYGEIYFLSSSGERLECPVNESPQLEFSTKENADSLSGLRAFMAKHTDARIVLGGEREKFRGRMPGIFEEVLFSLERRQALYLAGGFGGATLDVIRKLRPEYAEWFPALQSQLPSNKHVAEGLEEIQKIADAKEWDGYENGLSDEENKLLAASYRPSEIAALIGKGLGQL